MASLKHGNPQPQMGQGSTPEKFRRLCIDAPKGSWDTQSRRGTMVTVRLLGNLISSTGERELEWEVKEPTPLRQLLEKHTNEIPEVLALLGQKEPECMLTVGIRIATNTTVVKDGDIIKVTPHNSQLHSADFPTWHGGSV
jgi:molybdopterin converting factor small subunit